MCAPKEYSYRDRVVHKHRVIMTYTRVEAPLTRKRHMRVLLLSLLLSISAVSSSLYAGSTLDNFVENGLMQGPLPTESPEFMKANAPSNLHHELQSCFEATEELDVSKLPPHPCFLLFRDVSVPEAKSVLRGAHEAHYDMWNAHVPWSALSVKNTEAQVPLDLLKFAFVDVQDHTDSELTPAATQPIEIPFCKSTRVESETMPMSPKDLLEVEFFEQEDSKTLLIRADGTSEISTTKRTKLRLVPSPPPPSLALEREDLEVSSDSDSSDTSSDTDDDVPADAHVVTITFDLDETLISQVWSTDTTWFSTMDKGTLRRGASVVGTVPYILSIAAEKRVGTHFWLKINDGDFAFVAVRSGVIEMLADLLMLQQRLQHTHVSLELTINTRAAREGARVIAFALEALTKRFLIDRGHNEFASMETSMWHFVASRFGRPRVIDNKRLPQHYSARDVIIVDDYRTIWSFMMRPHSCETVDDFGDMDLGETHSLARRVLELTRAAVHRRWQLQVSPNITFLNNSAFNLCEE